MNDMLLVLATLLFFLLGYFVIRKIDSFIEGTQQSAMIGSGKATHRVRIASQFPKLFTSAPSIIKYCSRCDPYVKFSVSSGRSAHLLKKLRNGSIDIALLSGNMADIGSPLGYVELPGSSALRASCIYAVWNRAIESSHRDRTIFVLRNRLYSCKRGLYD